MPFYVSALPTGADTCNVEEMSKGFHGNSNLQGSAGYKLNATKTTQGNFEFTISGPGDGFEGVLVYVVDANNKRLGQFVDIDSNNIQFKDCGAKSATITHKSKSIKNFPFKLNWNAQGASGSLTVKSLVVVKSVKDWAQLDDVKFDSASGISSTVSATGDNKATQSDGFLQKYSLFIIMISITTLLYVVGSVTEALLKRQQVKARSFAKTLNGFGNAR